MSIETVWLLDWTMAQHLLVREMSLKRCIMGVADPVPRCRLAGRPKQPNYRESEALQYYHELGSTK